MSSFYSILYCTIRPSVDERISIGLYLIDGDTVFFRYSHEKTKALKSLLPYPAFKMIKSTIENIDKFINGSPVNIKTIGNMEFPFQAHRTLNESFVGFLATHANNLLTFSAPVKIDILTNEEMFGRLFEKYIYKTEPAHLVTKELLTIGVEDVKMALQPKISTHVNWEVKLTSENIPNLVAPTQVLFIGKNQVEVTGEAFDFSKGFTPLKNEIYEYLALVRALKDDNKNSTNFLIGDEPDKSKYKSQHEVWKNLRQLPIIKYVATNETEVISEYMDEHNVHPFIDEVDMMF